MNNQKLIDALNQHLANLHIMNYKLHNYHWNVKGSEFFRIHEITEKYYDYFFELFDEVAERILQLEGKPLTTVKEYLDNTTLKEDSKKEFTGSEVASGALADFKTLLAEARKINEIAEENSDVASVNMIGDVIEWLEKAIWMLGYALKK